MGVGTAVPKVLTGLGLRSQLDAGGDPVQPA